MRATKNYLGIYNSYILMCIRLFMLYVLMGLCRLIFYVCNHSIIGSVTLADLPAILKASYIFESASIFYVNLLFIALTLIPFYFREHKRWQQMLSWLFFTTNAMALAVNIADIYYFPFKLSRIAGDDIRYLFEDNITQLMHAFFIDYWIGFALYGLLVYVLYQVSFVRFRFEKGVRILRKPGFYTSQSLLLALNIGFCIFAIRGFDLSAASFPITMSDVTRYVKPQHSSLALSNPFCLIRTAGKRIDAPKLTDKTSSLDYQNTQYVSTDPTLQMEQPNIVILTLESFGSAHIKSLSDDIDWQGDSYTPFLDSLFNEGLLFTNAFQSTRRSIDAMPAIWASIPSYKQNFLAYPHAISTYRALPSILNDRGYHTQFLHGAVSNSMSFKAFGKMAGINDFVFQENYEAEVGKNDFDGKWGIWDSYFFPYIAQKLSRNKEPFFSTVFSLSSHHPYKLPEAVAHNYAQGKHPIHRTIRYTDDVLRQFFATVKHESWYANTLFVITADHTSGAQTDKWLGAPYNSQIPIFFFTPNGALPAQKENRVAAHVDIMPTILGIIGNEEPYFCYGRNLLSEEKQDDFIVTYNSGTYNVVTDKWMIQLDDMQVQGVYDYRNDPLRKQNQPHVADSLQAEIAHYKKYIQNYYTNLTNRTFLPVK